MPPHWGLMPACLLAANARVTMGDRDVGRRCSCCCTSCYNCFSVSFMDELRRHTGPDIDVPADSRALRCWCSCVLWLSSVTYAKLS